MNKKEHKRTVAKALRGQQFHYPVSRDVVDGNCCNMINSFSDQYTVTERTRERQRERASLGSRQTSEKVEKSS